jgi:Amt family ammonium transporter
MKSFKFRRGLVAALLLVAPLLHAATPVPTVDKGDVAWMLTSTLLVLLMTVPGLALFYGGLVRSKNVLSVLMQVLTVFSLLLLLWVAYGYSLAFGGGAVIGGFGKLFLHGMTKDSLAATFTAGVALPEYVFVAFQATFAGITGALIVGALAERMRFRAVLLFAALWFSFAYLPIAHMVWAGPDGFLYAKGALDFAGGTVVHINAGVAGLVGAWFVGPRVGFGREPMKPHNVTFTMIGAALLWVGWFGFNAGSNLEANAGAALVFLNTLLAAAAAVLAWLAVEASLRGHASMVGGASGAVAGLVGITPACGTVGPLGAIVIGALASLCCVWGVTGLKKLLRADDALDVFGVHGIGGIVGALLTGVFTAPALGGTGAAGFPILRQLGVQVLGVGLTVLWSGVVSVLALLLVKLVFGLRVPHEAEREGLDITSHGESAYDG